MLRKKHFWQAEIYIGKQYLCLRGLQDYSLDSSTSWADTLGTILGVLLLCIGAIVIYINIIKIASVHKKRVKQDGEGVMYCELSRPSRASVWVYHDLYTF